MLKVAVSKSEIRGAETVEHLSAGEFVLVLTMRKEPDGYECQTFMQGNAPHGFIVDALEKAAAAIIQDDIETMMAVKGWGK